ncbi:MAG: amidohydrolase family protein [Deltaproteobacteria bacterium]|nr:amidohydrolase family protein [Deltaproteobacteria bacterium]
MTTATEQAGGTGRTLIRGGTIIDGTGRPAMRDGAVVVAGERIAWVGPAREAPEGPYDLVIEAAGKTMMPGLIDAHCHTSYGEVRTHEEEGMYPGAEYSAIRAAWNMQKVLRAGVTGICDPGSRWGVAVAVRDAMAAGLVEGPRMTAAGQMISTHASIGDLFPLWVGSPPSNVGVLCNTRDEMVREVRRQVKQGVDLIKVAGSGDPNPVWTPSGDVPSLSLDELKAIVEETHRLGKKVTIHARAGLAVRYAAEAGVDWVIHGDLMNETDLGALLKTGIPICPTLTLLVNTVEWGHLVGASQGLMDSYKRLIDSSVKILSLARQAGLRFMAGTDAGFAVTPFGHWHARELEIFVKYLDFTPMEAIMAATRNNAVAVNLEQDGGVLEPGRYADLLVVDGDPLGDIRVLQDRARLAVVMKGGRCVDLRHPWPQAREMRYERTHFMTRRTLYYDTVYGPREGVKTERDGGDGV